MQQRLYRVLLHGTGFPGVILGSNSPIGLYTTRFVEADSTEEAEMAAVEVLCEDASLNVSDAQRTRDARVFAESIVEVPRESPRQPNAGFTLYSLEQS